MALPEDVDQRISGAERTRLLRSTTSDATLLATSGDASLNTTMTASRAMEAIIECFNQRS